MSEDQKKREILFFKDPKRKLIFILMSFKVGMDEMFEMFPNVDPITEEEADEILAIDQEWETVFVGDDKIIDQYFSDHFKYDPDGKNQN